MTAINFAQDSRGLGEAPRAFLSGVDHAVAAFQLERETPDRPDAVATNRLQENLAGGGLLIIQVLSGSESEPQIDGGRLTPKPPLSPQGLGEGAGRACLAYPKVAVVQSAA